MWSRSDGARLYLAGSGIVFARGVGLVTDVAEAKRYTRSDAAAILLRLEDKFHELYGTLTTWTYGSETVTP